MPFMAGAGRLQAFQCIGCGRIESPEPCIGVCEDRKVELVYASQYEEALAELRHASERIKALEELVRQIACTRPRAGEWERSYRALQNAARKTLTGVAPSS